MNMIRDAHAELSPFIEELSRASDALERRESRTSFALGFIVKFAAALLPTNTFVDIVLPQFD
jgi:hypothetical protein